LGERERIPPPFFSKNWERARIPFIDQRGKEKGISSQYFSRARTERRKKKGKEKRAFHEMILKGEDNKHFLRSSK